MEPLIIISSFLYILVFFIIFNSIRKASHFWVFFVSIEYFYLFGLSVYPWLLVLGYVQVPQEYSSYIGVNSFNYLTFLHIILYSVGALFGFYLKKLPNFGANSLIKASKFLYINPISLLNAFFILSTFSACIYIYFVGFEQAVVGASFKRSGNFDFFDTGTQFAFLTRFTMLGLFALAVYPYIVSQNRYVPWNTVKIFIIGLLAYAITVSRYAIFEMIIVPILFLWAYNFKRSYFVNIIMVFTSILAFSILLYGKTFIPFISMSIFTGKEFGLPEVKDLSVVFMNFGHLVYSVDAGVSNFFQKGPLIAKDVLLSALGFFPSSFYSYLGAPELSYHFLSQGDRSACINTFNITRSPGCTIPPYFTGISAYLAPLFGGFVFGFIRFYIYAVVNIAWVKSADNMRYLPIVLLMFLSLEQLMLFIPSTISLVVFLWIIISLYIFLKKVLQTSTGTGDKIDR